MNAATIVFMGWSFCNVLRDAGVSYGDDLERLTDLVFLKITGAGAY